MFHVCYYTADEGKIVGWGTIDQDSYDHFDLPGQLIMKVDAIVPQANFVVDSVPVYVYIAPTVEELVREIEVAVTQFLNQTAKANGGWDSINNAVGAASLPGPFQAQALTLANWWSSVWAFCFIELGKFKTGLREITSPAEFITELPPYQS